MNFTSTPSGALVLHVPKVILYLKRKLVGVAIGTAAAVGETVHAAFLVKEVSPLCPVQSVTYISGRSMPRG